MGYICRDYSTAALYIYLYIFIIVNIDIGGVIAELKARGDNLGHSQRETIKRADARAEGLTLWGVHPADHDIQRFLGHDSRRSN